MTVCWALRAAKIVADLHLTLHLNTSCADIDEILRLLLLPKKFTFFAKDCERHYVSRCVSLSGKLSFQETMTLDLLA